MEAAGQFSDRDQVLRSQSAAALDQLAKNHNTAPPMTELVAVAVPTQGDIRVRGAELVLVPRVA
jgi:hypothetical protein